MSEFFVCVVGNEASQNTACDNNCHCDCDSANCECN